MHKEDIVPAVQQALSSRQWLLEAIPQVIPRRRIGFRAAIVLLLLVTWLGTRGLNADSLWFDETWSLFYAGGAEYGPISPVEVIGRVVEQLQHEKNPPGYYVILNVWGAVAGWSEFAGRTLSLLMGVLAVAWTYRLGYELASMSRSISGWVVGLGAASVVGTSAFFIYYSHELRAYVPAILFATLAVWTYWRLLAGVKRPGWGLQAAFVVCAAGALYIHYSTVIVLGTLALYHVVVAPKNQRWWRVTVLGVMACALFLPWAGWLLVAAERAENLSLTALKTPELLTTLAYVFSNGSIGLMALAGAYAVVARGRGAGAIWFFAFGGLSIAVILNTLYPVITHVRYLIILWPLLAVPVGLGIERLAKRGISPWLVLGIWLAAGMWNSLDPFFNRTLSGTIVPLPWREMRVVLQTRGQPGDVVLFDAPDFHWYRDREMQHYMDGLPVRYSLLETIAGLQADDEYYQQARAYLGDAPRVWLGADKTFPPNFRLAELGRLLSADYARCLTVFDTGDARLDLYGRKPSAPDAIDVRFGAAIGAQLIVSPHVNGDGDLSTVLGWWVGDEVPPGAYSVGLHLLDSHNNLVAQADYGLPEGGYHCLSTTIEAPAGNYKLALLVYNWQTGERLTGSTSSGERGDSLTIATIAVK